jgi:hypothetical protein
LLRPDYVPDPESGGSGLYSTIGLLRKSADGFQTLAVSVIPAVKRFSTVTWFRLDSSSTTRDVLEASFTVQNESTRTVKAEVNHNPTLTGSRSGLVYLVGGGSPCTNLPQREIAIDSPGRILT